MSRSLGLLFALCLLALLAAPTAIRAAATPRVEVKTGLRVVATIYYSPARPGDKGFERRAGGLAVKIFPQKGGKAVAEVKTDDKGVFVVPLPAGKYRVEAVAFEDTPARRQERRARVEVKEGAVSEAKLKFTYARR
jgi:hypothetical protein